MDPLLEIEDLKTYFFTSSGVMKAVDGVSFKVPKGGRFGIVGESGSGKSVTAFSILRLVSAPGRIVGGKVFLHRNGEKTDLLSLPEDEVRKIRGGRIAMVFQEPMTSLNPIFTIGDQIEEAVDLHGGSRRPLHRQSRMEPPPQRPFGPGSKLSRKEVHELAVESLRLVKIPDPERVAKSYPHELSGGMRQRAMIAMALSCRPDLLIADEPTTALDVTIQAQVLNLLLELQEKLQMAFILITHDFGIIAETVEEVAVMREGKIIERGSTVELFENPQHPYTRHLLSLAKKL